MSNIKDRKVKQVTVDPALAERWLKKNTTNREIRQSVVDAYALAMKRGEWKLTAEPIMFSRPWTDPITHDQHGETLMDGQHRLLAVVKSNVSCEFMVWFNCDYEEFKVIGQACPRTASDILGYTRRDIRNPETVASVCSALTRFGLGEPVKNHAWVTATCLEHFEKEIVEVANARVRLGKFAPRPVTAALLLAQIVNPSQTGVLIQKLKDAVGFTERDPARALHLYLSNQLIGNRDTADQMFYRVCNGVAAMLDGRSLMVLRVNSDGLVWLRDGGKDRLYPLCRALFGKVNASFLSPKLVRLGEDRGESATATVAMAAGAGM